MRLFVIAYIAMVIFTTSVLAIPCSERHLYENQTECPTYGNDMRDRYANYGYFLKSVTWPIYWINYGIKSYQDKSELAAANNGDALKQYDVGIRHYYGRRVPKNHAIAANWFDKSADLGEPLSQNILGYMYLHGEGGRIDPVKGAGLYREAGNQGLAVSQNNLGIEYEYGGGVRPNRILAYVWYSLAADQDYGDSAKHLTRVSHDLTADDKTKARTIIDAYYNGAPIQN